MYPDKLCAEIVKGLIDQMEEDRRISQDRIGAICAEDIEEGIWALEVGESIDDVQYWDDMTGFKLDPALVKIARKEEIDEYHKHQVYEKVPLTQCIQRTGKKPIGIRWVYINKGDEKYPEYRARLVAKEINKDISDSLALNNQQNNNGQATASFKRSACRERCCT